MLRLATVLLSLLALTVASPAARASDLDGKWQFVLDTEGGERQVAAEFHLEGEQVKGTWSDAPVVGTFKDGKLELAFDFTPAELGEKGTMKVVGKLDGDTLSGNWEFSQYSGTYKAVRKN